jgi:hypothetical protein
MEKLSRLAQETSQKRRELGRNRLRPDRNPREPVAKAWQAPATLKQPGRRLWDSIMTEYAVEDAAGLTLLEQACQALDRAEALRLAIDRDGEVIMRDGSPRVHPAIKEETSCRGFALRALRELGVGLEPVKPVGRPAVDNNWGGAVERRRWDGED